MTKGTEFVTDGPMAYDSSSQNEPKRSHQWFMDGADAELFPLKRQTVEVPSSNLFSGMTNSNVSPWGNASDFLSASAHFSERQFDSELVRTINFDDKSIPSISTTNLNMDMGRKAVNDPYSIESSFSLAMSHTVGDPRSGLHYGPLKRAKVNQVKDSDNLMPVSMGHAYTGEDSNTVPVMHTYNKLGEKALSMGLTYSQDDEQTISVGDTYNREGGSFMSIGQHYNKGSENLSIGQAYNCGNENISAGHTFKENNDALSIDHAFSSRDSTVISIGHAYNNEAAHSHFFNKGDSKTVSSSQTYKGNSDTSSISHSYNKGENNIISFSTFHDDDENDLSGRLLRSYDLFMGQPSVQRSDEPSEKSLAQLDTDALTSAAQITVSGAETVSKKKDEQKSSKKVTANNFPSNVRSLLSTGILDGVPVKYIAWSREELCGVIKGSGYLCGCQPCNFSKVINAYEFERHAGCKTKHPNNHIYFGNGKTIYGIVQELRSTPQNLLFDVIQTITGSPINQKSFRLWKESFLAATRELQRIYGKDEGMQLP